jgi:hypothetical protein
MTAVNRTGFPVERVLIHPQHVTTSHREPAVPSLRRLGALAGLTALLAVGSGCSILSPAPELDFPLLEAESAGDVTEPGAELGIDDFGWVESTHSYGEGDEVTYTVGVALRELEPLTADDWPDLVENPEEFAGYTPVVLIVEQHVFGEVPEGYSPESVDVFPIYETGEVAPYVVVDFALGYVDDTATCGRRLYESDTFDPVFQYCLIGASEEGEIVGIRFDGQTDTAILADESTPYWANPIVWRA